MNDLTDSIMKAIEEAIVIDTLDTGGFAVEDAEDAFYSISAYTADELARMTDNYKGMVIPAMAELIHRGRAAIEPTPNYMELGLSMKREVFMEVADRLKKEGV